MNLGGILIYYYPYFPIFKALTLEFVVLRQKQPFQLGRS